MASYFKKLFNIALSQKCVNCGEGPLFKSKWSLEPVDYCATCKFPWKKNDSGDGPAVFLTFILGFSIIPLALIVNAYVNWPLWLHTLIWGMIILICSVGLLKPSKAITIAIQYWQRPRDWDDDVKEGEHEDNKD